MLSLYQSPSSLSRLPSFLSNTHPKSYSNKKYLEEQIRNASPKQIKEIIDGHPLFFAKANDINEIKDDKYMREYLYRIDNNQKIDKELLDGVKNFLISNLSVLQKLKKDEFKGFGGRKSRRSIKTNKRSQRSGTRRNRRH
jgi:hypothetical protein